MKVRLWRTPRACLTFAGLAVASAGCAGNSLEQRDLGNTATPINPTPVIDDGVVDPFVTGRWLGQAEDVFAPTGPEGVRPSYVFPSGSSDIRLELSEDGWSGQLVFGAGVVPEAEPGVAYPPGFDAYAAYLSTVQGRELPLPPMEGLPYWIHRTATGDDPTGIAAGALGMGYAANEAYQGWCQLQTPRRNTSGAFDCMTEVASIDSSQCDIYQAFDCNLGALCQADTVCHCFSGGCRLQSNPVNQLWLIRDGDDLLGNFVGAVFDYGNTGLFLPPGAVRFRHEAEQ